MSEGKVRNAYESYPVSENTAVEIVEIRRSYSAIEAMIEKAPHVQDQRYLRLAKTALEESAMWAIKSLTHVG